MDGEQTYLCDLFIFTHNAKKNEYTLHSFNKKGPILDGISSTDVRFNIKTGLFHSIAALIHTPLITVTVYAINETKRYVLAAFET